VAAGAGFCQSGGVFAVGEVRLLFSDAALEIDKDASTSPFRMSKSHRNSGAGDLEMQAVASRDVKQMSNDELVMRLETLKVGVAAAVAAPVTVAAPAPSAPAPAPAPNPHWSFLAWTFYMSVVGGLINGVSLSGIFFEATTHMTGDSSKLVIRWMHPPKQDDVLGQSISGWWYLAFIMSFSMGSFIAGAVLCERDMVKKDGSRKVLQMDSPHTCKFKTTHQIMFTWEMLFLILAAVVTKYVDDDAEGTVQQGDKYSKFMYSMCLVCCAAGMHNSITTASKTIIVRSTHVTGTITDIFMVLGFYARTGNPIHLWKLKVCSIPFHLFFLFIYEPAALDAVQSHTYIQLVTRSCRFGSQAGSAFLSEFLWAQVFFLQLMHGVS
jgi:hypothetical protein